MGKTVLHTGGAMVWNSLPDDCKKANSFQSMKLRPRLKSSRNWQAELFVFSTKAYLISYCKYVFI